MKTIEIEVILMKELNVRQHIIVPNVSWGITRGRTRLHECDILKLTKAGYATEYEIKISKSDFMADKKKKHHHESPFIKQMYYVVPLELEDYVKDKLEDHQGLIVITKRKKLSIKKPAANRKGAWKWTDKERFKLAHLGCMRILNLKKKLIKGA